MPINALACTTAGRIQAAIDSARRVIHQQGFRPYRIRLVWQEQSTFDGTWNEVASLELQPVRVSDLNAIQLIVSEAGTRTEGTVTLTEVSPLQVDEYTLLGFLNGERWGGTDSNQEFFYELEQTKWCPGDPLPQRLRFVPASKPNLDITSGQWVVELTDQFGERSSTGEDQTTPSDYVFTNPAAYSP